MRKVTSKLGVGNSARVSLSRSTRLLAVYLVLFMLLSTGSLFALTEGYQNLELSNQVDGLYSHQTIVGATWQADNSGPLALSGKSVTIFHYVNNVRYNDVTAKTDANGQITLTQTFGSAGPHAYYATFAGDSSYLTSTSSVVNVNVGSNQGSSQATTNVGSVVQTSNAQTSNAQTTTTLSASTATPAVNHPFTLTATLTSRQVVYGDYYNAYILRALGLGDQAQIPFYPYNEIARGSNLFLGTYNIENNKALLLNYAGVNMQVNYTNVTSLIGNRSLIYSNGGASVYS